MKLLVAVLLATMAAACGDGVYLPLDPSVATQLTPVVTRIAPAAGKAGDTITIFGFGFSSEPQQNIILLGGATATADSYNLVDPPAAGEVEQITFVIPASAATTGATTITVNVYDNVSNSDVAFTVTP